MNPCEDEYFLDHSNAPLQPSESLLSDDLCNFRVLLKLYGLDHSSATGKAMSYVMFAVFTLLIPLISCLSIKTPRTATSPVMDTNTFNVLVEFPESGLAIISFLTLLYFFRIYSLRQLLFLDDCTLVKLGYSLELDKALRGLACILLPSFLVELVHKTIFFSSVEVSFPFIKSSCAALNFVMLVLVLFSWVYRTGMFLLVCVLFRLTCELLILRFRELQKLFHRCGSDTIEEVCKEHVRIRKQLLATSHRYRFFIITSFVVISTCQFAALLMILASKSEKSFFNSGDLVVCSAVQLSGFFLCLLGAARITHRAQGVVCIATRWHMALTCASEAVSPETDTDSSDNIYINVPPSLDLSSFFQARQALVEYLRHNNKGITLYGYALDRGLLHTLFAFEFSLVMWILSKVVVLS